MIKNTIRLIILVVIIGDCSSDKPKSAELLKAKKETPIYIDLPKKGENTMNVSNFADTVIYIPLETNSKSLLGGIIKIQLTDEFIFISGRDKLLLFSKKGKFVRQIGKKGKGPGEYLRILDFVVTQDTVYITSTGKRSLLIYNVNGDFLKEQSTPLQLAHFNVTPEDKIVTYDRINGTLIYFTKQLNVADTVTVEYNVSNKRAMYGWWDNWDAFFQEGVHRLLFTNYMSDTIWNITNSGKGIAYILNLGDKLLPWKCQAEYYQGDFKRFEKIASNYQKINLFETPCFLFLFQKGWIENDINSIYINDVASNTTQKYETPYIFDDLVGKQSLVPRYGSNDCLVATVNPFELKEKLKKKTGEDAPSPLWVEQMSKVKENDNSILVIMPVRNKTWKTE